MHSVIKKLRLAEWYTAVRGYSLLISFTSWAVAFLYSLLHKGNLLYGLAALAGILLLHTATNIFDDTVDYILGERQIKKGLKSDFNFPKFKCELIFNNTFSINQYIAASVVLFLAASLTGIFFVHIYGIDLFKIIIPTALLCLSYPVLGCLGFGELIVALIFSPLLYLGVNFVMTGSYSKEILLISISTGLLCVAVLHNHMLLDYNFDEANRKTTLCRLCRTPQNALYLLAAIIICSYLYITVLVITKRLDIFYLIVYFSIPTAITLYNIMFKHINAPDEKIKYNIFMGNISDVKRAPENQKDFMLKFVVMRNLLNIFTMCICIAMVLSCIL